MRAVHTCNSWFNCICCISLLTLNVQAILCPEKQFPEASKCAIVARYYQLILSRCIFKTAWRLVSRAISRLVLMTESPYIVVYEELMNLSTPRNKFCGHL